MKVFWSRCGPRHGNFGDKLTPLLLKSVGISVIWAPPENADLIGIGSILEKAPKNFKGIIWTSGFKHANSTADLHNANIVGLRGWLTMERVQGIGKKNPVLGDAGLLCYNFARNSTKKFKLGLIPHFVDAEDPVLHTIANSHPEIRLIDICDETQSVIDAVSQCENILSSSLHGLILADALRVPAAWMILNRGQEVVEGEGFKFHDYFSVFGLSNMMPLSPAPTDTLDTILPQIQNKSRSGLEAVQQQLQDSLKTIRTLAAKTQVTLSAEQTAWAERMQRAEELLRTIIPPGAPFLCVDEDQIRHKLSDLSASPFLQRDGSYWGPPADSQTAIAALHEEIANGAQYIAFFPPAFWWLQHFREFAAHLRDKHLLFLHRENLVVFELKSGREAE